MSDKPASGERFPDVTVPRLGGGELRLGKPVDDHDWQIVVVYRGKHCPICKTDLTELERTAPDFARASVGVVAVSGDPEDRARTFIEEPGVFVVTAEGLLQVVDISNAPFARPDLAGLAKGLKFIRDNDHPIRGRLAA